MPKPVAQADDYPHEHEFTADVVSWINQIIANNSSLPFSVAKFDRRTKGLQARRDFSLIGKDAEVAITGELKLPYQKDGATPYNAAVVSDARKKAKRAGASHFFTWNVNECVLWSTEAAANPPSIRQSYRPWKVAMVTKPEHLTLPSTEDAIKNWLAQFLAELGRIMLGRATVGFKSPDERFVETLESALNLPIQFTFEELEQRHKTVQGKNVLDSWMRDDQGWTLASDPQGIRDNLERTAKFACYALVNRLVFYEALMKRYGAQLQKLKVPDHIDKSDDLRLHVEAYFADAKRVTGDYETVFGEDHTNVGNRIPFYSSHAVPSWRALINQIHEFDFSKLDYEIIGNIFERLISPDERHKYGQYYTRVEVVDLINSFCLRDGTETLMDPACGGGTFLVRAYARKRELAPSRSHETMIKELFGVDISQFACHLTTINLATRDLIEHENYPRVARSDFFDVATKHRFLSLPIHAPSKGLGKTQHRDIEIPLLDAVVGNPPYVRQEDIKSDKVKGKGHPKRSTKEYYRALVKKDSEAQLSGRSDLHCYFWPHAASFLKPDGWLCLLTSSQWLDVEYGFRLQDWMLSRFKIIAIFESIVEPWFVGARVVTAATILRSCADAKERDDNVVRFVRLREPLAKILTHDGTTAGAVLASNDFRDEILRISENAVTPRYRVRLVPQRQLLEDGIRLMGLMRASASEVEDGQSEIDEETQHGLHTGKYYGGKWGMHLRAPDLWFRILDRFGDRVAPLGQLTEVRFGVKSGKDEFFFPRDVSQECLIEHTELHDFNVEFGVSRKEIESGDVKLVRCGERLEEIRPIEAKYLEPEIHSLMEVKGYTVGHEDCGRMILLVNEPKSRLKGTHVLNYIEWGESKGWHTGATCAARVAENSLWYDLTKLRRPQLILPKIQQYRLQAFINPNNLYQNSSLLGIYAESQNEALKLGAVLNSSFALLSRVLFARVLGNEGNIQLDVYSAKMMIVPILASGAALERAVEAFRRMIKRPTLQVLSERRMRHMAYVKMGRDKELEDISDFSELDMEDRHALDDAIFEMLGVTKSEERKGLLQSLYAFLREFFEDVRQKEELAIANKNKSKRRAAFSPTEVAMEILSDVKKNEGNLLRAFRDFVDLNKPHSTFDLPALGVPEVHEDIFARDGSVRFLRGRKQISLVPTKNRAQAALVATIASHGIRGLVRVPLSADECAHVGKRYETFVASRDKRLRTLIAERTGDPDLQDEIYIRLEERLRYDTGG